MKEVSGRQRDRETQTEVEGDRYERRVEIRTNIDQVVRYTRSAPVNRCLPLDLNPFEARTTKVQNPFSNSFIHPTFTAAMWTKIEWLIDVQASATRSKRRFDAQFIWMHRRVPVLVLTNIKHRTIVFIYHSWCCSYTCMPNTEGL